MEQAAEILLLLILVLQLIVLIHLICINIKRRKDEKKFYEDLDKINQKILDDLKTKPAVFLEDSEESTVSEQKDKKEKTSGNRRRNQKRD